MGDLRRGLSNQNAARKAEPSNLQRIRAPALGPATSTIIRAPMARHDPEPASLETIEDPQKLGLARHRSTGREDRDEGLSDRDARHQAGEVSHFLRGPRELVVVVDE